MKRTSAPCRISLAVLLLSLFFPLTVYSETTLNGHDDNFQSLSSPPDYESRPIPPSPISGGEIPTEKPQADYLKQGIANLKEENYEEAVDDLKKAREHDPNSSVAAYFLGTAYKKIQEYSAAKVHLNDAITLQPAVKEAIVELADTLYQLDNMNEALETLGTAESEGMESGRTAFLKGLILEKLGKNVEAILSFKKAKTMDNELATSADYRIGLIDIREGRLAEARDIFKEIVIRDPNADIAQFANQYMDSITKRLKEERPFHASFGLQYQYDDNVLLKPADSAAAAGITNEADRSGILTLMAEYAPGLKGPYDIKARYSLYLNAHEALKTYDIQSHTIALVPAYNFSKGSISLFTSYNYTLVHDEKYLRTFAVSPTYRFTLNEKQFAETFVKYLHKEFLRSFLPDEDRTGNDYGAGVSWFYLVAGNKGFINAGYEFNKEDTAGQNWRYSGNKLGLSFVYPLTENLKFNMGTEAYLQDYDNTHTAFNKKREDRTYTFNPMLSYNIFDDMDVKFQYVYTLCNSNIAVYAYSKNVVSAGVEVRF